MLRTDLNLGVEPGFVTYSAHNARAVLGRTIELLTVLIRKTDEIAVGDNAQWVNFASSRIDVVRARALSIPGVEIPPADPSRDDTFQLSMRPATPNGAG